jgi:glyoxylate reductase
LPEAHAFLDRHLDVEIGAVGRDLTREELILKIRDKEGLLSLLVDTVDREVMESAPRLKIIANCAVGYNNIDTAWAAGLDVFEQEPRIEPGLLELENVVLLPHIGSASFETRLAMASTAAHNLVAGLSGEAPPNLVKLPELDDLKLV